MDTKIYALIPVRMGSKGIPNKNIRKIGFKTLLEIAIKKCQDAKIFEAVIVSSENPHVLDFAEKQGARIHKRSPETADDVATLQDVAIEVVKDSQFSEGALAIVQATSPSFGAPELRDVALSHVAQKRTTTILVKPVFHLHWRMFSGFVEPLFSKRVNRQFMEPELFSETGAVLITDIKQLLATNKISTIEPNLVVANKDFEDIDTMWDFYQAKNQIEGLTVLFRISANQLIGSGHLYHALLIADELPEFRKVFILHNCDPFVESKLKERGFQILEQGSDTLFDLMESNHIDPRSALLINDTLDTEQAFWDDVRKTGLRAISIEDLGSGPSNADVTINALYSSHQTPDNAVLSGAKWTPLRREFELAKLSANEEDPAVTRVTVTFGGVDPANLTQRVASLLEKLPTGFNTKVILGIGYTHELSTHLTVLSNPQSFESEIANSDLVITSGGRTVYEAGFLGKPCIVIAQNARETSHNHLDEKSGVVFLGIHSEVSDEEIATSLVRLIQDASARKMLGSAGEVAVDGRGAERIAWLAKSLLDGAPIRELIEAKAYKSDQLIG